KDFKINTRFVAAVIVAVGVAAALARVLGAFEASRENGTNGHAFGVLNKHHLDLVGVKPAFGGGDIELVTAGGLGIDAAGDVFDGNDLLGRQLTLPMKGMLA